MYMYIYLYILKKATYATCAYANFIRFCCEIIIYRHSKLSLYLVCIKSNFA